MMQQHRWPRSIHCQVEAVFHCIRAVRKGKDDNPQGIRSFGCWKVYRYESHQFADCLLNLGILNIFDAESVAKGMNRYLEEKLGNFVKRKRSRQTFETALSSLGKFEYAVNSYVNEHKLDCPPLDVERLRRSFYKRSKTLLPMSSRGYDSRSFPDPLNLIGKINDSVYQLQATLQYEGGLRCEGVGAPRERRLKNPLTAQALRGIGPDPVTELLVGHVASVEKGGKETLHFVSLVTYRRLENHILLYGKLESDYHGYINAINLAAKETGQFVSGRGSHALKHNFAEERYLECVAHGMSHEGAMQQTSLEMAHFRMNETLTYTRGHKK